MTVKVEFIYDLDCPNVEATRTELLKAFTQLKIPAKWQEWDRNQEDSPEYAKRYGSPTILINGKDIGGSDENEANCCRVYHIEGKLSGIPSSRFISQYMEHHLSQRYNWKGFLASLPPVGLAVLPKLTCAACWPAYAGILSTMGFGFLNYTDYLLPITVLALFISVFALGYRAKRRRGYFPLILGVIGSFIIGVGKFYFESDLSTYFGIVLLFLANFWNIWPKQNKSQNHCVGCT